LPELLVDEEPVDEDDEELELVVAPLPPAPGVPSITASPPQAAPTTNTEISNFLITGGYTPARAGGCRFALQRHNKVP